MPRATFLLPGFPVLLAGLLLGGCRRGEDPFYARNADLVALLAAKDRDGGSKYLVAGRDGELFYLEDVRASVTKWRLDPHNSQGLARLDRSLDSVGVRLLVIPVPSKVETHPEWLTGRETVALSGAKSAFLRELDSAGSRPQVRGSWGRICPRNWVVPSDPTPPSRASRERPLGSGTWSRGIPRSGWLPSSSPPAH